MSNFYLVRKLKEYINDGRQKTDRDTLPSLGLGRSLGFRAIDGL